MAALLADLLVDPGLDQLIRAVVALYYQPAALAYISLLFDPNLFTRRRRLASGAGQSGRPAKLGEHFLTQKVAPHKG